MLFLPYVQMNTLTVVISFLICYRENVCCKTQTIMTLSIPDKAKVNAKHYIELSYPH